jgi:hypothetical protein
MVDSDGGRGDGGINGGGQQGPLVYAASGQGSSDDRYESARVCEAGRTQDPLEAASGRRQWAGQVAPGRVAGLRGCCGPRAKRERSDSPFLNAQA